MMFKKEQSIKILKILDLINNIKDLYILFQVSRKQKKNKLIVEQIFDYVIELVRKIDLLKMKKGKDC